jgi:hypothetical protein
MLVIEILPPLGHESLDTTQIYLDANLALKEEILAKTQPVEGKPGKYRPDDHFWIIPILF